MNFSLNQLKELYEKYSIMEVGQKQVVILKNDIEKVYISEIKLVTSVKFAYAWVYANSKNISKNFLEVNNKNYEYAFDEDSEYLYDTIMEISKEYMETTGDMINLEALINFTLEDEDISEACIKAIQNLYSSDEIYQTFENWVIYLVNSINA